MNHVAEICASKNGSVLHIVQERVKGIRFDEWLKKTSNTSEVIRIILQVAFALAKAQEKRGFVHNTLYPSNIVLRSSGIDEVSYHLGSYTYKIRPNGSVPTIIDYSSARATSKGFAFCYLDNPTLFYPGTDLCKLISSSLALVNKSIYSKVSWMNDFFHNFFNVATGSYGSLYEKYDGFNLPLDNPLASLSARDFIRWVQTRQGELFNRLVAVEARKLKKCSMPPSLPIFDIANFERRILPVNYNLSLAEQYDGDRKIDYVHVLEMLQSQYRKIKDYICMIRAKANDGSKFADEDRALASSLFEIKESLRHNILIIQNLPLYRLYLITEVVEHKYRQQKMNSTERTILSESQSVIAATSSIFPLSRSFLNDKLYPVTSRVISNDGALARPITPG